MPDLSKLIDTDLLETFGRGTIVPLEGTVTALAQAVQGLSNMVDDKGDTLEYDDANNLLMLKSGDNVLSTVEISGGGGSSLKIGDVSGAAAVADRNTVRLTWSDPEDVYISGTPLVIWGGTMVVRKAGSAPADRNDGTVVVNSKTRNAYATNALVDSGLTYGTTYYYRFFPYTDGKKYTDGSSVSATPERTVITTVPTQDGTLTYDGTEQTASFNNYDSSKMTVAGNTGTNAGGYTAQFTPKEGYCWSDGSITAKSVQWQIDKASLTVPTQSGSLTYNRSAQSPLWDANYDSNLMNVSGNSQTNAGSYNATFSLIDTYNYQWIGGTTSDKTASWTIGQAQGAFTLAKNSVTLDGTHLTQAVNVTGITGDGAISVSSSDSSVATASYSNGVITISHVNKTTGTATVTVSMGGTNNYAAPASQTIAVTATFTTIYGVQWDGTSTTKFSRTDAAQDFTDPSPAVNNGTGSSPFDNLMPWSGMEIVEDSDAGKLVRIPKFWYKWTRDGSTMKLQIADGEVDGFLVSPAHQDRGDGNGERDYVYVGRYHCASDYKSKTGVKPLGNKTRAEFRSGISNLGSDIWQYDYAMYWTIAMLYLVEFGDWNSQATIGYGCGNNSGTENMGSTDGMQYHTGTNAANRTTYGHTQYRYIEDLWGNVFDWCDGIYFGGTNKKTIYGIKNPSQFSDSSGGTNIGTRPTSSNYISAWNQPSASGFEYALYPSAVNGSESTYVCDCCYYYSSGVVLSVGGSYYQDQNRGLFCLNGDNSASSKYGYIGSRLQKLP